MNYEKKQNFNYLRHTFRCSYEDSTMSNEDFVKEFINKVLKKYLSVIEIENILLELKNETGKIVLGQHFILGKEIIEKFNFIENIGE